MSHYVKNILLHLYGCNIIIFQGYNNVKQLLLNRCKNLIMNNVIEKKIGNNIRMLREKAGMTQEELATKLQIGDCDITRSAVAKIEVGQRHLYPDEIILIKEILNVSYDEIFKTE